MHGLGLEHEFRLVYEDTGELMQDLNVEDILEELVNIFNWDETTIIPGTWLLSVKRFLNNKKSVAFTLDDKLIKIAYFYYLLRLMKWDESLNKYYVAYLNNNEINLKYLYLFLGRAPFPNLEDIEISLKDIYLIRNPYLVIKGYKSYYPNSPAAPHPPGIDTIQINKTGAKIPISKLRSIPFNESTLLLFNLYINYSQTKIIRSDLSAENIIQLVKNYNSGIIEDEYQDLIEVKNIDYRNAKIKDVMKTHKDAVNNVISAYKDYYARPIIIPDSQYMDKENVYTGSYHVWFTLPKFKNVDRHAANYHSVSLLQWMEPLLFTYGMNDINYTCKSSFRMCGNNKYSGFGSTDPKKILGKTKKLREIIDDTIFVQYKDDKYQHQTEQVFIYEEELDDTVKDINGNDVLFIEESGRLCEFLYGKNVKTYFDYIEDWSGEKIEKIVGNDIRFLSNKYMDHLIVEKDDKLSYVYYGDGWNIVPEITEEMKFNRRHYAFEVRFFDHISLDFMQKKIQDMLLLFQHAIEIKFNEKWCFLDEDWHKAMAESLYHGHTAVLNPEYLTKINTFFGTTIPTDTTLEKFWESLIEVLYQKHGNSKMFKDFM